MSETLVACRFLKRHQMWNRGEVASFPLGEARRLDAMRLIEPLHVMVPVTAMAEGQDVAQPAPNRQPASVVRK